MLFSCLDHPCSWPGPRLSSGVTSFRLSWASPGPFLLVSPSLYPSHLGPHQPAQSKTAGMISYSPCKPSTWHRCSINVSLKGTQTELGDAWDSKEKIGQHQRGLHASWLPVIFLTIAGGSSFSPLPHPTLLSESFPGWGPSGPLMQNASSSEGALASADWRLEVEGSRPLRLGFGDLALRPPGALSVLWWLRYFESSSISLRPPRLKRSDLFGLFRGLWFFDHDSSEPFGFYKESFGSSLQKNPHLHILRGSSWVT